MELTVRLFVALLALVLVAVTLYRLRETQRTEARVGAICASRRGFAGELEAAPERQGLISALLDTRSLRSYLLLVSLTSLAVGALAGWWIGIALSLILTAGYSGVVRLRETRLRREFTEALPEFLDRVRRRILIGNTFQNAFIQAALEADPVVKKHLEPVIRRMRHGASFSESIENLAQRMGLVEVHMLAAYVKTNARNGGRISENLVTLVRQLKDRQRLEREVRAATAETRASAMILSGLTVAVILLISVMNPDHIGFFLADDWGIVIMAGIVIWPVIGVLVMSRILVLDY